MYVLLHLSITLVASYTNVSLAACRLGFRKCVFQLSINKNNGPNFPFAKDHSYLFGDRSSASVSCLSITAASIAWMLCAYQWFALGVFMAPLSKCRFTAEHCTGPELE